MESKDKNQVECTVSRCRSWLICAISFMVQFIAVSFFGSFGPMYVEMLRVFKAGDAATAWIPSIAYTVSYLVAPIIYPLCDRVGYRISTFVGALLFGLGLFTSSYANSISILYFTIGVMVAIGYSLCQATSMFILPYYFGYDWSLALGITMSGSSFGAVAFSSFKAFLFDRFGYRTAMQLLASTAVPIALGGLTFKKQSKAPSIPTTDNGRDIDDRYPPLSRNKVFYMLLVASFVYHSVFLVTYVHLTRLAGDLGISDAKSALLPGAFALSESAGKIFNGKLVAHFSSKTLGIYQTSWLGIAISLCMCPFAKDFNGLVLFAIGWGFCIGNASGGTVLMIRGIVGSKNTMKAYSIFLMCFSPAILIGPPVAGWLREKTSSYKLAFYMSGGIVAFAASLLFVVKILHRRNKKLYAEFISNQLKKVEDMEKQALQNEGSCNYETKMKDSDKVSMIPDNNNTAFFFNIENALKDSLYYNLSLQREIGKKLLYIDRETSI